VIPMPARSKLDTYRDARSRIVALLEGANDAVAAMSGVAAVLFDALPEVSWVGFYRVVGLELLRVGPYQGPVGCQEIAFGKGVCGVAAATGLTQVVLDVHAFPGHIACDARSLSEIVVPVFDPDGSVVAVLDLDSHRRARFDNDDKKELERIARSLTDVFSRARD